MVTDANNCTATTSVTVTEPTQIVAISTTTDETCVSVTSGSLDLTASGGIGSLTYQWDDAGSSITEDLLAVGAGTYNVIITDDNGCVLNYTETVPVDTISPVVTVVQPVELTCIVTQITIDGSSSEVAPEISYDWTTTGGNIIGGTAGVNIDADQPGDCTLTLSNSRNSCVASATVSVTQDIVVPNAVILTVDTLTCLVLNVDLDGTQSTSNNGVMYQWSTGDNIPVISTSSLGAYTLTVSSTFANGCTSSQNVTITVTNPGVLTISGGGVICEGDSAQVDLTYQGGLPDYTYEYTNGVLSWTGVGTGNHSIFVTESGNYVLQNVFVNGCPVVIDGEAPVTVNGLPAVDFIPSDTLGCTDFSVNFENLSSGNSTYVWDFGDGTSSNQPNPTHVYTQEGCYEVTLSVTDNVTGCVNSLTGSDLVCAVQTPVAGISIVPEEINPLDPIVYVSNSSIYYDASEWDITELPNAAGSTVEIDFVEIGNDTVYVTLIVSNNDLCFDTLRIPVMYEEVEMVYVPNVFTPDNSGVNDDFGPIMNGGVSSDNYEFLIFNRWGELIWKSNVLGENWDGRYNGELVQDGVYVWAMSYKNIYTDEKKVIPGHVTVLK